MNQSIGILEVVGNVTALACADAMIKSAFVEIHSIHKIGSGMIAVMVTGDLASVQFAVETGQETAASYGELVAARVIPRPSGGLGVLTGPLEGGEHLKVVNNDEV
ncbi:BMC domain-containing protein [Mesobacillus zeae]|uniref:BMC domain-containing protein n=1 Tax=Mesobacillus zeae TaxID=1917180 RepID=A0A398B303_9BACI|nr:BMC domain-containing protein [Mesobacillus zeae]RID84267.1 BMC domain-containing protein [Mesobacillus zeae]